MENKQNVDYFFNMGAAAENKNDFYKAVEYYTAGYLLDHPSATNNLARLYEVGLGVEKNTDKAIELYKRAIELNNTHAMVNLSSIYINNKEYKQAIELCNKAIELKDANAMNNLGIYYFKGYGVERDYKMAKKLYERAIKYNNTSAMINLATLYEEGLGVNKDPQKVITLYKQAVSLGDPDAMYNLAVCYKKAYGVQYNIEEAILLYTQAISLNHAGAMNGLANYYYYDSRTKSDTEKAIKLYEKAIELNNYEAMYNLATYYKSNKMLDKAIELYKKAAEFEHAESIYALILTLDSDLDKMFYYDMLLKTKNNQLIRSSQNAIPNYDIKYMIYKSHTELKNQINDLQETVQQLFYAPGMQGYTEAKNHFEASACKPMYIFDDVSEPSYKIGNIDHLLASGHHDVNPIVAEHTTVNRVDKKILRTYNISHTVDIPIDELD